MVWNWTALVIADICAAALIIRLLSFRLHRIYKVFSIFVAYQVLGSLVVLVDRMLSDWLDYRILWLVLMAVGWCLTLWTAYVLLDAVLGRLPGILRFSRWVLLLAFLIGVGVALLFLRSSSPTLQESPLKSAIVGAVLIERAVSTVFAVAATGTVLFVLWFPVEMPKNLARFVAGLVLYQSVRAIAMFAYAFTSVTEARSVELITTLMLAGCYLYWTLSIVQEGEAQNVIWGRRARPQETAQLVSQLEAMNAALWRSARR